MSSRKWRFRACPKLDTASKKDKMDFLLTLDQEHFLTQKLNKTELPLKISTAGIFIQKHFS